jgi:RHS repeat-associated protein
VVEAYEFRRFQTGANPFWTPVRFPGQYFDSETDLFENWNRYYDSSIGRYMQSEPMLQNMNFVKGMAMQGMSTSVYAYANNSPLHFVDPNGRQACPPGSSCAGCFFTPSGEVCCGPQCVAGAAVTLAAAAAAELAVAMSSETRWEKAKDAIREICRKPKRWYACAAACQGNGASSGAEYLVGWSNENCADATRKAKESAGEAGQTYPRHCACIDTDGFRGEGTMCENHSR